ncbi:MAG TPA: FAD binding domain-containing protein [Burkholderiales bacterium]|nr:FAD binding domain-containing protein [Burkholderiales bacterium]
MRAFEVVAAGNSREAVALLVKHGPSARVLAGGTDLLADFKTASRVPDVVIDISRAEDMKGIGLTDQGLRIGALVTHAEIMRSALLGEVVPAMVSAAQTIGAVQTRNLGTLGGNLVTCVPSMDSGPVLIALGALATVAGPDGRRQLPLEEFFAGPRKSILKSDEVLLEIVIPGKNLRKPADFLKFGLRKGQALALVNVAVSFWVDGSKHIFAEPRIALGAVAPTVIRAPRAERCLEGCSINTEAMVEAGRIAACEAKPIDDFRASADYRRDLIAVLTRRALENAYARATAQEGKAR